MESAPASTATTASSASPTPLQLAQQKYSNMLDVPLDELMGLLCENEALAAAEDAEHQALCFYDDTERAQFLMRADMHEEALKGLCGRFTVKDDVLCVKYADFKNYCLAEGFKRFEQYREVDGEQFEFDVFVLGDAPLPPPPGAEWTGARRAEAEAAVAAAAAAAAAAAKAAAETEAEAAAEAASAEAPGPAAAGAPPPAAVPPAAAAPPAGTTGGSGAAVKAGAGVAKSSGPGAKASSKSRAAKRAREETAGQRLDAAMEEAREQAIKDAVAASKKLLKDYSAELKVLAARNEALEARIAKLEA